jgi:hypothetical protein
MGMSTIATTLVMVIMAHIRRAERSRSTTSKPTKRMMLMASQAIPAMMVAANTLPDFPVEDILVAAAVTPAAAAAATAKDNSQGR